MTKHIGRTLINYSLINLKKQPVFIKNISLLFTNLLLFIIPASAQLTADFSVSRSSGCSPLLVSFTNQSANAVSYLWNFGNGNTSTLPNPSASFINQGTYTVTLTTKDVSGTTMNTSREITVAANPVAAFTANRLKACVNDSIHFTDLSLKGSGNITSWSWDFGDGSSDVQQNPEAIKYTFSDDFKVTLVIKDDNGCQSTITKNGYIGISDINADFIMSGAQACKGPLPVQFTNTSLPVTANHTYLWDFGDGSTATSSDASHTYNNKGSYPVTLTVSNAAGCKKSVTRKGLVNIFEPQADFTVQNTSGCAPLSVNLINRSSAADTSVLVYEWKTSAGHRSALKEPAFIFTQAGSYSITLKIKIPGVCADSLTRINYITVSPRTPTNVSVSEEQFCSFPAKANFSVSTPGINVLGWIWGDHTTSAATQTEEKTFNSFGQFRNRLVTENAAGCRDTILLPQIIRVQPSGFRTAVSKKSGCVPFQTTLQATDTGMIAFSQWEWKLNGAIVSNTQQASVMIIDTGLHIVTCTAGNTKGCVMIITDTIKGGMMMKPLFSADKTSSCVRDAIFAFKNITPAVEAALVEEWRWEMGDYGSAKTKDVIYQYANPGIYRARLIAIHKGCATHEDSAFVVPIKVNNPRALFNLPVLSCANDSLLFTDLSKGPNQWHWLSGDGAFSDNQHFRYKYALPGTYQVSLVVHDTISGCADTMVQKIIIPVFEQPDVVFSQSAMAACPSGKINFNDRTAGNILSSSWLFGNGQTINGKTAAFSSSKSGYYSAKLTVKMASGCLFSYEKDSAIRVYGGKASVGTNNSNGCLPLTVNVNDQSVLDLPVTGRTWKWGNGDSLTASTPGASYTYTKVPANQVKGYTLQLTVTDSAGCTYSAAERITPSKPIARFNYSSRKGCGYDSLRFEPLPTPGGIGPFTYKWSMGEETATASSPVKKYTHLADTFSTVVLIVSDSNQCTDSVAKIIAIDTRVPHADFLVTPEKILDCPGPPVFFTDSLVKGASAIRSWEWSFGDGTRSYLRNPSKTYLEPGSYDVSLKITDSLGCTSSAFKTGYISIAGPSATYRIVSSKGCMPHHVSFEATAKNTKKLEWDMGDGTLDTNMNNQHLYSAAGTYYPSLTITDSAGCKRTLAIKDTVIVYQLPKPDVHANKNKICKGSSISFTPAADHDKAISEYAWNFGDGNSERKKKKDSLSHTYKQAGTFSVSLKVTDELGCADSVLKHNMISVFYDTIAPQVPLVHKATVLNNETVAFDFAASTDPDFEKYNLFYNYSSAGRYDSSITFDVNDTIFIQGALNTLDKRYFYSVSATDACRNESEKAPVHATIQLSATPAVNAVQLSWTAYKGWSVKGYEVHRLNPASQQYEHIATVDANLTLYTDTTTLCHKAHYYKIRAIQQGIQYSWSDSSGAVPQFLSTIPSTRNVRATVKDNTMVLLEWEKRSHNWRFAPVLYRGVNNEEPVFYKELDAKANSYIDAETDVNKNAYTYITYLKDECGAISQPSNPAKTILLSVELKKNDRSDYNPDLTWNSYIGWETGVENYTVEFKYDSLAHFTSRYSTSEQGFFDKDMDEQQRRYCYQVVGRQKGNTAVSSTSNMVCTSADPKLYAPNAFTPNGDKLNETFKISGIFMEDFNMKIWNRYGELIYETNDMQQGWDATYKGADAPADVYVYLAEGKGRSGKLATIKGSVTLMR